MNYSDVSNYIQMFAWLGTIITVGLVYRQNKKNHEWNRRKASSDFMLMINSKEFQKSVRFIRNLNMEIVGVELQDKTKNYSHLAALLSTNPKELKELKDEVVFLLNNLESGAILLKNNIADEDICYNFCHTIFIDMYYWLEPYIQECRKMESNEFILVEFELYAKKWEKRLIEDKTFTTRLKAKIVKPKPKL
jgi:hypothetical protein